MTTMIACPGVRPLVRSDVPDPGLFGANENRWIDGAGLRRRRYANVAVIALAFGLLYGGVWIVTEFVRLQKIAACYEAGRQNCLPLDLNRRDR
ncbi:MAG TPA: hypothetical protein PLQ11_07460 [Beijerinckiaceae bacterium]|nr:hypothetical protein [Beijerinckiaceae bacterium]